MLDNLGEHARLYMAFHEGQPIAGTLAIHYGDKVWYLYGASSNEHRNLMPNYLLQWSMIQWAVETGCSVYDFRGVSGDISEDNPLYGLYKFKKGFGGDFTEFVGEYDLVLKRTAWLIAEKGSVLARSDAGCAALFCKAAMQAAGLNVKVNTRLMADKARADALEARAEQLLAEFVPQADRVYQTVSNE